MSVAIAHGDTFAGGGKYRIQQAQPEVFIGPRGTKSEMHMDSMLIPFWMSVYAGKKKFRTISFEDSSAYMYNSPLRGLADEAR